MVDRHLGRYVLDEVIGVGSFATVHRAVDEWLDDVVVVKVLAENHSLNPEIRERFIAEGRSLRRVTSPNVIRVHDIGESERQQPYLVLEHADRGTLAARVARLRDAGWTATPDDLLAVARPLAWALDAVHRAQLVHRDLSPGNVLLSSSAPDGPDGSSGTVIRADERLLLADLGMCKDLARSSGLTVAGGTEGFRPPEQRGGPSIVDARADIWALSAVMAWLGEGADLPPALRVVLRRGLAEAPADRQRDVIEWLAEVEAAVAPQPSAPDRPSQVGRRSRWWLAALVALVVGIVGGAIGAVIVDDGDRPVASAAGSSVAITGPSTVAVGSPATFVAEVTGADTWVWTLPTGRHVVDAESVTIEARGAGTATVVLRAIAADGTELEVSHHVEVTA